MSDLVRRQWIYFQLLASKTSEKQHQSLINTITTKQIQALIQIIVNFLQNRFKVSLTTVNTLKRHKHILRHLADVSIPIKYKRQLIRKRKRAVTEFIRHITPFLKSYLK